MSDHKFTLSFSKVIEKKTLKPSVIHNDTPRETKDTTEVLESIEENVLKTDGKVEEEPELVIPIVENDRISILRRLAEKTLKKGDNQTTGTLKDKNITENVTNDKDRILTLEEKAEAEILEETRKRIEGWNERGTANSNLKIQAEQDEAEDLSTRIGKESTLNDYDKVEVEVFGAALLRGMGWKKSEGVGGINKQVIDVIDPTAKTFGLSVLPGEEKSKTNNSQVNQDEELVLAKGSHVFIHSGRHRGTYGIVESLDEDHLLLRTAVGQEVLREVELNIRVVSKKEYKDSSRVINKDMYDKFKAEEAMKNKKKHKKKSSSEKDSESEKETIVKIKSETKERNYSSVVKEEKPDKLYKMSEKQPSENFSQHKSEDRYRSYNKAEKIKEEQHDKYKISHKDKEDGKSENGKSYKNRTEGKYKSSYDDDVKLEKSDSSSLDKIMKEKIGRLKDKSKSSYDKYGDPDKSYSNNDRSKDEYLKQAKSDRHSDISYSKYCDKKRREGEKSYKKREKDIYYNDYKKAKLDQQRMPEIPWVRENLRVRIISKEYKGGRYYKEKVIVRAVDTAESCECVTEDGKTLRDVNPQWLETVIPKASPHILIVKGNSKGQRGRILQLHKDQEKASVQLNEDTTVIVKLHYEDICEYVSR